MGLMEMLLYVDEGVWLPDAFQPGTQPDEAATVRLAERLFPGRGLTRVPEYGTMSIGSFDGFDVVYDQDLMTTDHPSDLSTDVVAASAGRRLYLFVAYGVVDWFAYGTWADGRLIRSLSVRWDAILEDIGERQPVERAFWACEHPPDGDEDGRPVPFHPFHFGQEVIGSLTGLHPEIWGDPPPGRYLHIDEIPTLPFQAPPRERFQPGPPPPGRAIAL